MLLKQADVADHQRGTERGSAAALPDPVGVGVGRLLETRPLSCVTISPLTARPVPAEDHNGSYNPTRGLVFATIEPKVCGTKVLVRLSLLPDTIPFPSYCSEAQHDLVNKFQDAHSRHM